LGADDLGKLGLAEKKQQPGKRACRVFVLPCLIRDANAPAPPSIRVNQGDLWLNKMLLCKMIRELRAGNISLHFAVGASSRQGSRFPSSDHF
jgi:hypothetical protein